MERIVLCDGLVFKAKHKGTPISLSAEEFVCGAMPGSPMAEAIVSLFHHVLPEISHQYLRKVFEDTNVKTLAILRSVDDARKDKKKRLGMTLEEKKTEDHVEKHKAAEILEYDSESSSETSSFSGSSGEEEHDSDEEEEPDDDSDIDDGPAEDDSFAGSDNEGTDTRKESVVHVQKEEEDGDIKLQEKQEEEKGNENSDPGIHIRPKDRILAAVSYEEVNNDLGLKILQLTLIGVRTRFQGLKLGRLLVDYVKRIKDSSYDTIITYADHSAVRFFRRNGFTDDAILNSRFRALSSIWDQSTLMSVAPPPSLPGPNIVKGLTLGSFLAGADLDEQVNAWRDNKIKTYSTEVYLVEKMKAEIVDLRGLVHRYKMSEDSLRKELLIAARDKAFCETELKLQKSLTDKLVLDLSSSSIDERVKKLSTKADSSE